jgi:hypothetical protein
MTTGNRSSHREHSVTGPINLGDLRWLVDQCHGLPDSSRVTVKEHKSYNQMDWDPASITVKGAMDSADEDQGQGMYL